jgi:hypothetical protein
MLFCATSARHSCVTGSERVPTKDVTCSTK